MLSLMCTYKSYSVPLHCLNGHIATYTDIQRQQYEVSTADLELSIGNIPPIMNLPGWQKAL